MARVKERLTNLIGRCALAYRLLELTDCGPLKLEQSSAFLRVGRLGRRLLLRCAMGWCQRRGRANRNEEYDEEDARRRPRANTVTIRARVHHTTPMASLWTTIEGRCTDTGLVA